jgi:hypothetical protein
MKVDAMAVERESLQQLRSEILRVFGSVPLVGDTRTVRDAELRNWLGIIGWGLGERRDFVAGNSKASPWADLGGAEVERLVSRVLEAVQDFRCDKALMADVAAEIGRLEQKVDDLASRYERDGRSEDAKRLREECEAFRNDVREDVRARDKRRHS